MPFFVPGRTSCALTGELLERRGAAAFVVRLPELFEHLAEPGSEWVSRAAWMRWPHRADWVEASTAQLLATYADGPHRARRVGSGLVKVDGPHGGALVDLAYLWRLSLDDAVGDALLAAIEASLGGGGGEVALGGNRLWLDPVGSVELWDGDTPIESGTLPPERRAAWRAALGEPAGVGPVPTFAGEGTAHRLRVEPGYPGGAHALVGRLRVDLAAEALRAVSTLRVLGGHDRGEATEVWMDGDLTPWRAMATLGVGPAVLAGVPAPVTVESRAVDSLADLRRHDRPWPITWAGGKPVRRLRARGNVSAGQITLLVEHLEAAFGVGSAWSAEGVELAEPAPPERVLEMVVLWAQRAWVEPQAIEANG